jgi:hypothetical protein
MRRVAWLIGGMVVVVAGVALDRTTWFPGFIAGMLFGVVVERLAPRRRNETPAQPEG